MPNETQQEENTDCATRCGVVAITGPPNSGKSTLLNSFLGEKLSIVTPKPQTTRNRISGIYQEQNIQILFLDTPGIHYSTKSLNAFIVETAWRALEGADHVLLLLDASKYVNKEKRLHRDLEVIHERLTAAGLPITVALNKQDLVQQKRDLLPLLDSLKDYFPDTEFFLLSATRGEGTLELLEHIKHSLPCSPFLYPEDELSTLPMRFLASEIIREKLFLCLEQEVPYSVAVQTEYWDEDPESGMLHIGAVVYVAHKSHKAIVIGAKGRKLKEVGQAARLELEAMLEQRVYLQLWVKVKPRWTESRSFLLGLSPENEAL
jgi:GTP-binding protein Era